MGVEVDTVTGCRASELGGRKAWLGDALRFEVARLDALGDPVAAVVGVREVLEVLDDGVAALADVRLRKLMQLRAAGWSYGRLERATGLSKGRVGQLARQARRMSAAE
jgi:hypothetical protein